MKQNLLENPNIIPKAENNSLFLPVVYYLYKANYLYNYLVDWTLL